VNPIARRLTVLLLLAAASAAPAPAQDKPKVGFKVIVHASNLAAHIKKEQVATLFLGQARWGDGVAAAPVDQSTRSPIREAFSTDVLGKPVAAVQAYWQQKLIKDREVPPPVKGTDEEVIAFVAKNRGGVGYVAAETELPATVKAVKVE